MHTNRLNIESKPAQKGFNLMLSFLDSPLRSFINNPEKIITGSNLKKGDKVLELGCGSGFFTIAASKAVGENGWVHSTDLVDTAVSVTQKKVNENRLKNVIVSKADAHNTGLQSETYDKIILLGVVPAPIIDLPIVLSESFRLLKPKGQLAIWTVFPFWSSKSVTKSGFFNYLGKNNSVHLFEKKAKTHTFF